jgi:hypothetical protein
MTLQHRLRGKQPDQKEVPRLGGRKPSSKVEIVALAGALAWGGLLRLGWPGLNPFAFDEARLSLMALALARKGVLPSAGLPSSAGIPNLPAQVWLFAFPYALSSNPMLASSFVGLLSFLSIVAVWWIARSRWGPEPGLIAAWLMAGSPYLVFYSRSVWPQNWLPILSAAWLLTAAFAEKKPFLFLNGFIAGLAFQVHYAGIALFVPSAYLALVSLRQQRRIWLLGFSVAIIPVLIYGWKAAGAMKGVSLKLKISPESLIQSLKLVTGWGWEVLLLGPGTDGGWKALLLATILALWIGWALISFSKEKSNAPFLIAGLASPLIWLFHFTTPYIHYHLVSLPSLFLAAGYGAKTLPRRIRLVGVLLALGIALGQGVIFIEELKTWATKPMPGGLSAPLALQQAAVSFVKDGRPVIVVAPGDRPEQDGDAAVMEVLLWGYPHRIVNGLHSLIIPAEPSWLLFVGPWLPAWQEAIAHLPNGSYEMYLFPRREGEMPWGILKIEGARPIGFKPTKPVRLACGVKLNGWNLEMGRERIRVETLWEVEEPERRQIHQFNHLYLRGEFFQAQDGPTSSKAWAKGDFLVTWADFPPVEGEFRIAVGMYYYPSMERVRGSEEGIWLERER